MYPSTTMITKKKITPNFTFSRGHHVNIYKNFFGWGVVQWCNRCQRPWIRSIPGREGERVGEIWAGGVAQVLHHLASKEDQKRNRPVS
jgi:hypothetical protein